MIVFLSHNFSLLLKILRLLRALILVGFEFHFSAALNENVDCLNVVFLNSTEQSCLADALVSLGLFLKGNTHC